MFATGHTTPRLGIDLAGGTSILLQARSQPGKEDAINPTNMKTAVSIISQRVNGLGVSEAEVQTQGKDHIVVNIPRGPNVEQARKQVGTTAKLNFRPVLTYAPVKKQKSPDASPSPSSSSSGKAGDKGQDKASSGDKATASPSASESSKTQGRAVSDALTAAHTDDKASPSPTPSGTAAPQPTPSTPASGLSPELQKKLQQLDCTSKQSRAKAGRAAAQAKPSETVVACSNEKDRPFKYALGPVAVQGKHVDDANSTYDSQRGQGWIVQMSFDDKGSKAFADVTGKLAKQQQPQNQFAIVLDGQVVSAPSVHERLAGGSAEISGSFTQQSAEDLANILSYGALPLSFHEADVTTVTAALGGDQLQAGLYAGAIGLALVVLYLVFYYRGLSLVAIASLLVSATLTYTIMTLLGPAIGFALNLPAVCGAIVAIGITADSFIVYFERIRDEVREGRTLRPAVERAWPRARRTVLVSDFVSFLAAAVLFIVTVGKVKGFAFTLGLTTILDVVVIFLFTKPWMTILARTKFFSGQHPWSGLDPKRLGAKPPLRRSRRPLNGNSDPKEA
ncbi:MAG TPA: protein translocase subunit SecD [Streptomyces sp.]|nr:protein translocase subunit SecD [Streptomyces sp.]